MKVKNIQNGGKYWENDCHGIDGNDMDLDRGKRRMSQSIDKYGKFKKRKHSSGSDDKMSETLSKLSLDSQYYLSKYGSECNQRCPQNCLDNFIPDQKKIGELLRKENDLGRKIQEQITITHIFNLSMFCS